MRSAEVDHLKKETPERTQSSIAQEELPVSDETVKKKVHERVSDYLELSPPEFRTLVAQCLIVVVIAGIVGWLIAA